LKEQNDGKQQHSKGVDVLIKGLIRFLHAIDESLSGKYPPNNNTDDTNAEIAKWTGVVAKWTRYLVGVGVITAAILILQVCVTVESDRTIRANERAYVYPAWEGLTFNFVRGFWASNTFWENTGNTPTVGLKIETHIVHPDFSTDDPWKKVTRGERGTINTEIISANRVLAPHQKMPGILLVESPQMMKEIQSQPNQWFLIYRGTYDDVFKVPRISEKCQIIIGVTGDADDPSGQLSFHTTGCPKHNCTDEECDKPLAN
jgi:hypothetical protein